MIQKAQERGIVSIEVHPLRKYTTDRHKTCDDRPFGGGPGMVMKSEPLFACVEDLKKGTRGARVVLMSPLGRVFNQKEAGRLARLKHLIFICGHYEGVDERVREHLIDEEISIGDFITTGGELPCMCVVDSIVRLIPGVVGNEQSIQEESFQRNLLDFPHYTRPAVFRGLRVPEVLLSGDHQKVASWREEQAVTRTLKLRPDLLRGRRTFHEAKRDRNHRKALLKKGNSTV
jgi:tRNA (guanine37-N1)-methyltransferase